MKTKLILLVALLIFVGCRAHKPVATTHHERIEERLKPVAVGADTIELEYKVQIFRFAQDCCFALHSSSKLGSALAYRKNLQSTDYRYNPLVLRTLPLRQGENMSAKPEGLERLEKQITKIKSTRGLKIESRQTDSTEKLILTLRPDTVYVPYTTHIRSDTIVAPCPTTQAKLTSARWKIFALLLVLIAIIIFILKDRMTR